MKYLVTIIVWCSLIVSGCNSSGSEIGGVTMFGEDAPPPPKTYPIEPEVIYQTDTVFQALLEKFQSLAQYYNRNITAHVAIIFGNTRPNGGRAIGYCKIRNQQNLVVIDRNYWESQDLLTQENIIFHELGHCLLMRPHRQQYRVADLTPISLMHPQVIKSWIYSQYYYAYQDELFGFIEYVPLYNNEKPLEYLTPEGTCARAHD
jgi:hypothetical protein